MTNDSALGAIERMERALRRAETATERLRSRSDQGDLAARHRQLQDDVQGAIEEIDRLIGAVEGD